MLSSVGLLNDLEYRGIVNFKIGQEMLISSHNLL